MKEPVIFKSTMSYKKVSPTYSEFLCFRNAMERIQNNLYVSRDSIKPWFVKRFYAKNSQYLTTATCFISKKKKSNCIALKNKEFQNILRAAVRYYYNEQDYNPHLGMKLEEILGYTNKIFKAPIFDDDICEAAVDLISSQNFHRDPSGGVSLFYGHHKYGRGQFDSVQNTSYAYWSIKDIKRRKRLIKSDLRLCVRLLKKGSKLFRGRPEYTYKKYPLVKGEKWVDVGKVPFSSKKEMGPPPASKVASGRCGNKGSPLFYLASDLQAVISELKQKLATYISVGSFRLGRDIKVADLSALDYYDYAKSDKLIERYIYLKTIQELFMKPVNGQNAKEYEKTRLIAEIIKDIGYKGLIYNSSVSMGKNHVFFTDNNLSFIKKSARLVKIKKIDYLFKTIINELKQDPVTEIGFIQEKEL